jgi:predicted TIM-barrel fold metal-dependent hydrolase
MTDRIFDRVRAIDTDTHVTEPPDVWTSRVSTKKWGDAVPHVEKVDGRDVWLIRDQMVGGPGFTSMAGFDGSPPDGPEGYHDILKSAFDANERLKHMDAEGIHAQVLYPNVGGFGSAGFLKLGEPELMLECVRAYNDFLVDWCSADSNRLIPVAAMPFWDVNESVKEVERCVARGHKAILAGSQPDTWGQPALVNRHWDPFWAAVQDAGVPISFHIGGGDLSDLFTDPNGIGMRANFGRISSMLFMANVNCIADLIFGGICHRFPKLDFVSVESGVGWLEPYLEAADWQFVNSETRKEHPEYDLLPSEYFRRQIYGCFWFECDGMRKALDGLGDNIMWETDFPHPTCQHPGLEGGLTQHPADYAEKAFEGVPEDTIEKVLYSTAARLYQIQ